jgi:glutaredoxin 3
MSYVKMYKTPTCPYCSRAIALLKQKGVNEIEEIDISTDERLRAEMLELSGGRKTVPQIFINGQHVGGFDDLSALDRQGGLVPLLSK